MTKQQTQQVKGIAIFFMLFLHLFNQEKNVELCTDFIYIQGQALCHILTRMTNPVSFFIILSGYGLYAASIKGDKNRWKRIWNLLEHYWLILVIAVLIGHLLLPEKYPGNIISFISNFTAFNTTYNEEWWFLFPYLLLSFCSPWLFKLCNKFHWIYVLGTSYFLYLTSCFCISRYGELYLYNNMALYHPILFTSLVFDFLLGAETCKNKWFEKCSSYQIKKWAALMLILLCIIRCMLTTGAFHNLFVFTFICLFLQIKGWEPAQNVLAHLGNHSMNMWITHSFICYYFFHDWLYSFKYPIVIFAILLGLSYFTSLFINIAFKVMKAIFLHSMSNSLNT